MKKMQCLFERSFTGKGASLLLETVSAGCEWVLAGEGIATRKRDGTAVMFDGVTWYRRYDAKNGVGSFCFYPCEPQPDPITKHWPGWTPVNMGSEDTYIREAITRYLAESEAQAGTFEACGPKINSNRERLDRHILFRHGAEVLPDAPRTFQALEEYLGAHNMEGIVFWRSQNQDCDKCKIRRNDYKLEW